MTRAIVLILALALPILPNLWSIRHAFKHDFPTEKEKMFWIRLATFLPVAGGLAYLFRGRFRVLPPESAGPRPSRPDGI